MKSVSVFRKIVLIWNYNLPEFVEMVQKTIMTS